MKSFLIYFAIYLAIAWLPQFAKSWIVNIRLWWKRKHCKSNDKWVYK